MHTVAVAVGMGLVHAGNRASLAYRDRLVARARSSDPVTLADQEGDHLRAAWLEAARTQWACLAAGLTGPTVIGPLALSAYRGWVGGIVSVDGDHVSRLREPVEAVYYLSVIVLQLIPYSLAVGAGLNLGYAYFKPRSEYPGDKWLGYPKEAISDFFRIFLATIPLVVAANLWEFLSPLRR
ncbi:MAG TPA: hypothetical protein VFI11_00295 [Anaerolineales bacterium]|nr:hypothetical protein [Anaerolineales bacterium]